MEHFAKQVCEYFAEQKELQKTFPRPRKVQTPSGILYMKLKTIEEKSVLFIHMSQLTKNRHYYSKLRLFQDRQYKTEKFCERDHV